MRMHICQIKILLLEKKPVEANDFMDSLNTKNP